eukprot:6201522-Pleurochrysis_carterae.AAC.3
MPPSSLPPLPPSPRLDPAPSRSRTYAPERTLRDAHARAHARERTRTSASTQAHARVLAYICVFAQSHAPSTRP